jgi:Tfp pilus assembly protein PilO
MTVRRTAALWPIDLAGIGVIALILLAGYILAAAPLLRAQRERAALHEELLQVRQAAAAAADRLRAAGAELDGLRTAAGPEQRHLVSARHANQRLAAITGLAGEHGLMVDDLRTAAARETAWSAVIPVTLGGRGAFQSCARFLRDLRERFPDMGLDSFELADNPGDPADPTVFRFDLAWHAAPSASAAAE